MTTPETVIVVNDHLDPEDGMRFREDMERLFPGWEFVIIHGLDIGLYQLGKDGDYDRLEPVAVLDGDAVCRYLEERKRTDE